MTTPDAGEVRITIKDLYIAQKQYEGKLADSDKKLAESLNDLKLTLLGINTHIASVDQRNAAADELHREMVTRITSVERVMDISGVRTMREDNKAMFETVDRRLVDLEKKSASSDAVEGAEREAKSARILARQTFWFAVAGLAAVIGVMITLYTIKGH